MANPYPLDWPENWPRVSWNDRRASRFKKHSIGVQLKSLNTELDRLGASHVVISMDIELTSYGRPRSNAKEPDDPGVAAYFQWRGKPYVIACDQYEYCWENIRAIAKSVEAFRAIERHGASAILERAVSGFTALPPGAGAAPEETPRKPWWEVLGVDFRQFGTTAEAISTDERHPMRAPALRLIELLWKQRVKEKHPDRGGTVEAMTELNLAMEDARRALGKKVPDNG